jgi:hypothetical protein
MEADKRARRDFLRMRTRRESPFHTPELPLLEKPVTEYRDRNSGRIGTRRDTLEK